MGDHDEKPYITIDGVQISVDDFQKKHKVFLEDFNDLTKRKPT